MVLGLIGGVLNGVLGIVDKTVKDKDTAEKLKAEIVTHLLSNEGELVKAQASVINAEAQGESWLQRNWRPILMLSITAIVVNNFLLYPYLVAFGVEAVKLELPSELFTLMTMGVSGYIVSRGGEKIAKTLADKGRL